MKSIHTFCLILIMLAGFPATVFCEDLTGKDAVKLMDEGKKDEAIQILEELAADGDDLSMVQLGIYYYQGTGVIQDYYKAMDWWLQAFKRNNADAFVNLGVMHRDGQGVPQNKKIAYCVFLTTHMNGYGSQSTQYRSNSSLRRLMDELSLEDIKDCLSNYTLGYIMAYIEAKGKMEGIPEKYKPSKENPAFRDLDWWLPGELDGIFPPTEEEMKHREEIERQRQIEFDALQHTLVFQIRFSNNTSSQYESYEVITDLSMGSSHISKNKLQNIGNNVVFEDDTFIYANKHRYVSIKNQNGEIFVYKINHPVKPSPCDWGDWQKAAFILDKSMDTYPLLSGNEPDNKILNIPQGSPELRLKVIKE